MASLIQGYEYDIFISYRQKDNKGEHWVSEFVNALKTELESKFKEDVSVYFDENLHDGLLETDDVNDSLRAKLKCLVFIPIVSQTYCDPRCFAWNSEFLAFKKIASEDHFELKVKLANGNVGSRILPVKVNDLDSADLTLLENELGGKVRSVDFIYRSAGVSRPLIPSDNPDKNLNKTQYRDQVNKVANAIKEIISGLITPGSERLQHEITFGGGRDAKRKRKVIQAIISTLALVMIAAYFFTPSWLTAVRRLDKSVAVLPFENLSGDPSQEYFSDGISEQIQIALAQVEDLKVSARSSSFRFKGKAIDLRDAGKKLNVSTVLEGSVRREGNRVHINAELISVEDEYSLWSEQFDRTATVNDLFAIQREIATAIVQKLKVTLLQHEDRLMREGLTQSTEAYDAYLKGYYFWNSRQLREGEKYFRQAIALDSSFASAYAALAETDKLLSFFQIEAPHQAMKKAQEAAEKALKLDSLLYTPYLTLASKSAYYDWDREKAAHYFRKALAMNPRYAPAHYFYGQYIFFYEKDVSKAILETQKAVELEPFGAIPYLNLGIAYMYEKKFDYALTALQNGAELNKRLFIIQEKIGHCYIWLNQMEKARQAFELAYRLGSDVAAAYMVYFYLKEGSPEKAHSLFQELDDRSKTEYVCGTSKAIAASFLGQKDLAHQLLRKAIEERDPSLLFIRGVHGRLPNDLLSDQRNIALLENNLPKRQ